MLGIINNLFLLMLAWGMINFIINVVKVHKVVKENEDNPNIKGVEIVNGKVHIIEADVLVYDTEIIEEVNDLVTDPVCNEKLEKSKAYHVIKNGESHYFCSWECREKFLEPASEKHL